MTVEEILEKYRIIGKAKEICDSRGEIISYKKEFKSSGKFKESSLILKERDNPNTSTFRIPFNLNLRCRDNVAWIREYYRRIGPIFKKYYRVAYAENGTDKAPWINLMMDRLELKRIFYKE